MKTRIIIAAMMALGSVAPLVAQESENPDRAEVRAVIEAVASGMQAGDFASLDTLFTDSRGLHIIEGAG
ncbi:MAG: hypothetical protein ACKVIN_17010, partial [Longimicrobiales bacterium]